MNRLQRGFTILELVVVVAVIGILAASLIIVLRPATRIGEARDAQREQDVLSLINAIELYTADNGSLPAEFSSSTVGTDEKFVICSSGTSLSCNGETRFCLQVDNADFLGTYIATLPVDPAKSNPGDSGYYLTRRSDNTLGIGACTTNGTDAIVTSSRVFLPDYVEPAEAVCGNGVVEGGEVCDYSATSAVCPKSSTDYYTTGYTGDGVTCAASGGGCNSTCSACLTGSSCQNTSCPQGGWLSGGLCWYYGSDDQSCDSLCSSEGTTCVAANWNDDSSCTIQEHFVSCSGSCNSLTRQSAPFEVDGTACYYRSSGTPQNCATSPFISSGQRVCACNN